MVNFGDKENFDFELRMFASERGVMAPRPIAEQARLENPMTSRLAGPRDEHESQTTPAPEPSPLPQEPMRLYVAASQEPAPTPPLSATEAPAQSPVNPAAQTDSPAKDQKETRSHMDLRQHIQAQLEFIRNSRSDATRWRSDQLEPASAQAAPPDASEHHMADEPANDAAMADEDTDLADEQAAGATVVEMRPPIFRSPEPPPPPRQAAAKPVQDQPATASQESDLERISGNLVQLAAQGGVLRRIIEEKLTGQLLLISEGEQENQQELVYIQDGVMLGCSSLMQTPVRDLLLSAGLISMEQIEEARQQAELNGAGGTVESWLLRNGVVTREQVFETLGVAAREAVVGMMCREFGIFVWKRQQRLNAPKTLCKIPMGEVVLHYGRSLAAFDSLRPDLLQPGRIFKIHDSFKLMHAQYGLLPHEWKVLCRVDGKRTLRQIREAIDIPEENLNRHVFVCDLMGFIADCGLAQAEKATARVEEAPRPAAPPAAFPVHKTPQAQTIDDRPKILIVDDSRTVQKMVLMALEHANYHLRTADDGFEALQLIENTPPDLVLLDVIMPRMDGYKVCAKIRKLLAPVKIPIIMLTAKDGTYNNIRAKLAGATTVINKPFDPEELRQTIGKYLAVR